MLHNYSSLSLLISASFSTIHSIHTENKLLFTGIDVFTKTAFKYMNKACITNFIQVRQQIKTWFPGSVTYDEN